MWPTRSHCGNWDKVHWLALDPDYKVFSTTMLWINRELITKKRKPKPFNIPASKLSNSHFAYCPVTKRATWLSVGLFSILRKQSRRQQTMSRPSLPAPFPILMTQLGIWILVPHLTWPMIPKVWVFVLPNLVMKVLEYSSTLYLTRFELSTKQTMLDSISSVSVATFWSLPQLTWESKLIINMW